MLNIVDISKGEKFASKEDSPDVKEPNNGAKVILIFEIYNFPLALQRFFLYS